MDDFYFDHPQLIHLIWIFPVLWLLLGAYQRFIDEKKLSLLGQKSFSVFVNQRSRAKQFMKTSFLCFSWVFLVLACMSPRFGHHLQEVSRRGLDLMICLDVSRSMLAEDVLPNRLERTKLDLLDMINTTQSDRVGLIAFAGAAVSVCPLTLDKEFFKKSLRSLTFHDAPRGGTFIGDAIRKALNSFSKSEGRTRVIMVVTDGEDQDSLPLEAAKQAASEGIRIYTVGIGDSRRGTPIPVTENGIKRNLTYQDQLVLTKLNDTILKQIAKTTNGAYIGAGTSLLDLEGIYQKHILPLDRLEEEKRQINRLKPQFQWFLIIGIIFLVLDCLLGDKKSTKVTAQ